MRLRRRSLVFGGFTVVMLGAAAFLAFSMRADRVTPENYTRLVEGMAQQEVVAILGSPSWSHAGSRGVHGASFTKGWLGPYHVIEIWFDEHGHAVKTLLADASFVAGTPPTGTVMGRSRAIGVLAGSAGLVLAITVLTSLWQRQLQGRKQGASQ